MVRTDKETFPRSAVYTICGFLALVTLIVTILIWRAVPGGANDEPPPPHLKITSPWADAIIGIAYVAIPVELGFFVSQVPATNTYQKLVGVLFVMFILCCGLGHLLDAGRATASWVLADRYVTAFISAVTAALSPVVFAYSVKVILKFHEDRVLMLKQRDMLADAQAMAHLGNWEIFWDLNGDHPWKPEDLRPLLSVDDIQVEASDEWFRIFGVDISPEARNTIPLARYMALLRDADRDPISNAISGAMRGISYTIVQRAARENDGREIYIRGYGKPVWSESGDRIVGLRGTAQDITDEVRINRELEEANARVVEESKHKDVFLATMSHELRTPLTSIIGHVDLLEETPLGGLQAEYIANAKRAAIALLSLINDILDYSKLIAGVVEMESRPVALQDILQDVLAITKEMGREVTLKVDPYLGPEVMTDGVRVRQILLNLVSNALKFTLPGGFVSVGNQHGPDVANPSNERIQFSVRDTGIGMQPDVVNKLFQPFRQGDPSTNRRFGGSGLGLSIVKRLLEAMHGEITVDSMVNVGTTFTVMFVFPRCLPSDLQSAIRSRTPSPPEKSGKKRSLRILLAEDNVVTQKLVQRMLRGHVVEIADNGKIAVDMVAANPPYDLILSDLSMPIMDGLEATREIRQLPNGRTVHIIGLTANAFKTDRDACIEAGMNDYLAKPFSKQILLDMVKAV